MDFITAGFGRFLTPEVSAVIILIAIVFLIRRHDEKIDNLSNMLKERDERIEDKIRGIEGQIKDFITKEEHYRDVSGWRGELQKLESKLDRFIERFLDTRRE